MNQTTLQQTLNEADNLCQTGRLEEAAGLYQKAIKASFNVAYAHFKLGQIALQTQQFGMAELHFGAALAVDPEQTIVATNLASVYVKTNRADRASLVLRDVVAKTPQSADAWFNLGCALIELGDYQGAFEANRTAIQLRPEFSQAYVNLAFADGIALHPERALAYLQRARECAPSSEVYSTHILLSMYSPHVSGAQLAALAKAWDARYGAPVRQNTPFFDPALYPRDPERPLRLGYVAPSFCHHPVGLLVEPILAQHDRLRFLVHCYSDVREPDHVTNRFLWQKPVYHQTLSLSDEQLAQQVRRDKIDILIDLNLHTRHTRLGVFARRPAPLQINYLAYPFTGGVPTLDYRVTDNILEPPGQPVFGPEALLRLRACYWLYRPNSLAPEPARRLPARSSGHFTFANLNFTHKLNPDLATAWANILNQLPNARLLQFAFHPAAQKPSILKLFADAGLDSARIDIIGSVPHHEHLARYLQVDLCLDPFPYGGHTTTLDALWMGIPVLTLAGEVPYTRGAASILPRVGLDELVTLSVEHYQSMAVKLARDRLRLEALRANLRERMRTSDLCNEVRWVADFERGLRLAWRRFCQGLPPAEIDLNKV